MASMLERFENKYVVDKDTGCWNWIASKHEWGYGWFYTSKEFSNRKMDFAHRVSWALYKGEKVDKSICVCHECDNPSCVNPEHLFLGTTNDNMQDMIRKGRLVSSRAKLTEEQVLEIKRFREKGLEIKSIAKLFNISPSHCSRVSRGLTTYFKRGQSELQKKAI